MNESVKAIEAIIKRAIEGKNAIVFRYKKNAKLTKVEPYLIGELFNSENQFANGKIGVRAYYLKGYTSQKILPGMNCWRIYHLENIENLVVINEKYVFNRKGYNSDDKRFKVIFKRRA
jgi:hypothetical protein